MHLMRIPMKLSPCATIALLTLAIAPGCSDQYPVVPAEGKVFFEGKPLSFGAVVFQPEQGPPAKALIKPDGSFVLTTFAEGDGAIVGSHRVRVSCFEGQNPQAEGQNADSGGMMSLGRALIPRKYNSTGLSGLSFEIKETNEPFIIQLTAK